jgi:tRNA (guanosine-2'-O-)-methyltransferase
MSRRNPLTPRTEQRLERIDEVLRRRQKNFAVVLANIHDPHNVSAIYRSCDAFGVPRVHLYYTNEAFPILGKKTSASAQKWVETVRHRDAASMVGGFRGQGFQVLSTGFTETAKPLIAYDLSRPTAIILGNEHRGVDPELEDLVPDRVYIPMQGMVQSLNVSVAAAITLYEAWRQRQAAGLFDRASFSDEELAALSEAWKKK